MNRKGFTLVEVLAVIVILSVVMGIASYGALHVIESSGKKSEEAFVSKFVDAVETYMALNSSKFKSSGTVTLNKLKLKNMGSFELSDLVNAKLIDENRFINPKNKKNCYNSGATINVYQSDEYVNYYYFDFTQLNCDIDFETSQKFRINMPANEKLIFVSDLKPGDYIYYVSPSSSYSISGGSSGSGYGSTQYIDPSELSWWRVISVSDNGMVDMVSQQVSSKNIYFKNKSSISSILNGIANSYKDDTYIMKSRHFGYVSQTSTSCSCDLSSGKSSCNKKCENDRYQVDYKLVKNAVGTAAAYKVKTSQYTSYWTPSIDVEYSYSKSGSQSRYCIKNYYYGVFINANGNRSSNLLYYKTSGNSCGSNTSNYSVGYAIRPILTVKAGIICRKGDGSSSNPCELGTL